MKPSFFFQLLTAQTVQEVQALINRQAAEWPAGPIDMDVLTDVLMTSARAISHAQAVAVTSAQTISYVQTVSVLEGLLFALTLTQSRLVPEDDQRCLQIVQVATTVLTYQLVRRQEKLSEETLQQGHMAWRDDRPLPEAKRYTDFLHQLEAKEEQIHYQLMVHQRYVRKLANLQMALRHGKHLVQGRLDALTKHPQSSSRQEQRLLETALGAEEEPSWGSPPEGEPWSLRRFDQQLTQALASVRPMTHNRIRTVFQQFEEGVEQKIIGPLAVHSKSQRFVSQLKDWLQDTLYHRFGLGSLSTKSTLYAITESAYCAFLRPPEMKVAPALRA